MSPSAGYPTVEQVEESTSVREVLGWNRFLPRPQDDSDIPVLEAVVKRLTELRDEDPAAYTAASKSLGWG